EMVVGEHPFARESDPIRVTAAILNRSPVPPRDLVSELPRQISDRILWMLEKKVKRRPPSARALLDDLSDLEAERSGVLAAPASIEVVAGAPRQGVSGLVLRQETSEGERRAFLLFKERVTFGRSGEARQEENDLVLRCLPCRSQEQDPENW